MSEREWRVGGLRNGKYEVWEPYERGENLVATFEHESDARAVVAAMQAREKAKAVDALTDQQLDELEQRAMTATPGPWSNDTAGDPDIDFKWQQMHGPDGKVMFDSLNSDTAVIYEEYDENGGSGWDETARRNFEHIAGCDPTTILKLIAEVKRGRG